MPDSVFEKRSRFELPAEEVFGWLARPGALERLAPPFETFEIRRREGGIEDGSRSYLNVAVGPVKVPWISEHFDYEPGRQFRDRMVRGPFAEWEHLHRVEPIDEHSCELIDRVEYRPPLGPLGRLGEGYLRKKLNRQFDWRHERMHRDLNLHKKYAREDPMKIAVSGSDGLVGSQLVPFLESGGHEVLRLVRHREETGESAALWNHEQEVVEADKLEGVDAVVHLAGEPIVGRWGEEKKRRIRDSREHGTRLLCEALAGLDDPPEVFVCASAVGYYGDRGDEQLDESSDSGEMFLSEVCRRWESACEPAREAGTRVANTRFGIILSPEGGALKQMLPPFKMGMGGNVGNGKQWYSWITRDDAIGALYHAINTEEMEGPVNVVGPNPVRNSEFTRALGSALSRPTIFPLPAFAARLMFGEMADELLLASARVQPTKLEETGYDFQHREIEPAMKELLGSK